MATVHPASVDGDRQAMHGVKKSVIERAVSPCITLYHHGAQQNTQQQRRWNPSVRRPNLSAHGNTRLD